MRPVASVSRGGCRLGGRRRLLVGMVAVVLLVGCADSGDPDVGRVARPPSPSPSAEAETAESLRSAAERTYEAWAAGDWNEVFSRFDARSKAAIGSRPSAFVVRALNCVSAGSPFDEEQDLAVQQMDGRWLVGVTLSDGTAVDDVFVFEDDAWRSVGRGEVLSQMLATSYREVTSELGCGSPLSAFRAWSFTA